MIKNRLIVLHPFLFTLFPILSLYTDNLGQVPFAAVIRALLIGIAAAGVLLALFRLGMKDWHRAGLATTLAAMMFFTFGYAYHPLANILNHRPGLLAPFWLALFALPAWWIARRLPQRFPGAARGATRVLNITGALALATCLYGFGAYGLHTIELGRVRRVIAAPAQYPTATLPIPTPRPVTTQTASAGAPQEPDVYYIILDGHIRADVLKEIYGVDETPFINFLRDKGFYVAGDSHSNYDQTALSLASSLNFNYLDAKLQLQPDSGDRGPLSGLINNNDVDGYLKARGYRTVAFTNGFPTTEMAAADQFLQDNSALNNFEISLLAESFGGVELNNQIVDSYRQRIMWAQDTLKKVVDNQDVIDGEGPQQPNQPKFVFAHFILPHPPFVFNADGSPRPSLDSGDGSHYTGSRQDYYDGYAQQVQYADLMAEQLISYILDHSKTPPVIILQGDHGSGLFLDWNSEQNSCLRERFSILNAYYLPARLPRPGASSPPASQTGLKALYPTISPVNSFRVVLDEYFDAKLPLLPDHSYFSLWERPYDLQDITGHTGTQCGGK